MAHMNRFAGLAGMAAALSMAATPVAAADLPAPSAPRVAVDTPGVFEADAENADRYRRWRHRRGPSAGDVLAGVLIIGGIAAVASAASKNSRDRRYRDRDYRDRDYRYRDRDYRDRPYDYRARRGDSRYNSGRGIDRAVEQCVSRIERDARVDTVDSVDRTGEGWRVTGSLYNGERFNCRIGSDGRVDDVDYGGSVSARDREDRQWGDDRYEAAWNDVGASASPTTRASAAAPATTAGNGEQLPAYPGGPVDGDLSAQDDRNTDDRYTMAGAGS